MFKATLKYYPRSAQLRGHTYFSPLTCLKRLRQCGYDPIEVEEGPWIFHQVSFEGSREEVIAWRTDLTRILKVMSSGKAMIKFKAEPVG